MARVAAAAMMALALVGGAQADRYDDYLKRNGEKEAVTTTLSGLQYQIIKSGALDGPMPLEDTPCAVHYRGTLITGAKFDGTDSSLFGFPALFAPSGVIMGWTEALQMMHEGDRWKLTIPARLAYGERGAGDMIPAGATLVFDLHLVKVFEGTTARSYPGSVLLENVVLGPIPDLGYFCVRVWMALLGCVAWMWWDANSEPKLKKIRRR